jgi:hypothetical protein
MSFLTSLKTMRRANGKYDDPALFVLSVRDKNSGTGDVHLADVLIERREEYVVSPHTRELMTATIAFEYQRLVPSGDLKQSNMTTIRASYSAHDNVVSLVDGGLFLDLEGLKNQRIGTYLMSSIVRWAKQWPTATVAPLQLLATGNTDLRNHFYRRYGLELTFTDSEKVIGSSLPMPVSDLIEVHSWKDNIRMKPLDEYVGDLLRSRQDAVTSLDSRSQALREWLAEEKLRCARPIRWALGQVFWRFGLSR